MQVYFQFSLKTGMEYIACGFFALMAVLFLTSRFQKHRFSMLFGEDLIVYAIILLVASISLLSSIFTVNVFSKVSGRYEILTAILKSFSGIAGCAFIGSMFAAFSFGVRKVEDYIFYFSSLLLDGLIIFAMITLDIWLRYQAPVS